MKVEAAVESLSREILTIQATGDKAAAGVLLKRYGLMSQPLETALIKLEHIQVLSLSLLFSVSLFLSVYLLVSLCLSLHLFLSFFLSIYVFSLYLCLSPLSYLSLSALYLYLCLSLSLSPCLPLSISLWLTLFWKGSVLLFYVCLSSFSCSLSVS